MISEPKLHLSLRFHRLQQLLFIFILLVFQSTWCCSVCKRKMSKILVNEDSTESHLEIPTRDIQRRHSDVKLSSQNEIHVAGLGRGLAPPRSSDAVRRHSDVSPATLKDLEKVSRSSIAHLWDKFTRLYMCLFYFTCRIFYALFVAIDRS